jgi:hypothetical protein
LHPVDDTPATPPTTLADCSVILIAGYGTVKRRGGGGEFGGVEEWLCVRIIQDRPKSNPALMADIDCSHPGRGAPGEYPSSEVRPADATARGADFGVATMN